MKPSIASKLAQLAARLEELNRLLSSEDATRDMDSYRRLTREHAEIAPVVALYQTYLQSERDAAAAEDMTRDPDLLMPAWEAAADQIAAALTPGTRGVYLLLGDPLLYGTFTYLWHELAQRHPHIQVSVIPGVTSFAAAADAVVIWAIFFSLSQTTLAPVASDTFLKGMYVLPFRLRTERSLFNSFPSM